MTADCARSCRFPRLREPARQRQSGGALLSSITILLQKLDSSVVVAMLGAYNNTVENPDPEERKAHLGDASAAPASMLILHKHCDIPNTRGTKICQKHARPEDKLGGTHTDGRNKGGGRGSARLAGRGAAQGTRLRSDGGGFDDIPTQTPEATTTTCARPCSALHRPTASSVTVQVP